MILGFTVLLAATQPLLWLHPFGVLTKNLPLLAIILVLYRLDTQGWDARTEMLLRVGMAIVWLTDGLAAQFLYGSAWPELAPWQAWLPAEPTLIRLLGVLLAASGVAVLVLRGWPRRGVLLIQMVILGLVPLMASFVDPLLWVHPFGPLTKNVPLLIGTWMVFRCSEVRGRDSAPR
jgi:DoxX-like family